GVQRCAVAISVTASGPTGISGAGGAASGGNFAAGTYTLGEVGPSDYTASLYSCVKNNAAAVSGDSIVLGNGDTATCTITNDDKPPTLTLDKPVVNDNGGARTAGDCAVTGTGGSPSPATFAGSESGTAVTLNAGSYSIDEAAVSGYAKTLGTDCSGTITNGETKTCTITNDDVQPTLHVVKHVVNNNGGTATASNSTLSVTGGSPSPASFPGAESPGTTVSLNAGSYSVSETGPSGYSASVSADCAGSIAVGETKTCTITNDDVQPQ